MFAHQVIEELKPLIKTIKSGNLDKKPYDQFGVYYETLLKTDGLIKNAFKFHIESYKNTYKTFESFNLKPLFMDGVEYLRMPYRLIWLDYLMDIEEMGENKIRVRKRGMLISEIEKNFIQVAIFNYIEGLWALGQVVYFISMGEAVRSQKIWRNISNVLHVPYSKDMANIQPLPLVRLDKKQILQIFEDDKGDLETIRNFLLLINCKNIKQKRVNPDKKLNKKRSKKNKIPLFSYKILEVSIPKHRQNYESSNRIAKINRRLHFCRGHFKEYTKEAPLFGKITGLYWWQPHVRGNKKRGVVMKDYKVAVA